MSGTEDSNQDDLGLIYTTGIIWKQYITNTVNRYVNKQHFAKQIRTRAKKKVSFKLI